MSKLQNQKSLVCAEHVQIFCVIAWKMYWLCLLLAGCRWRRTADRQAVNWHSITRIRWVQGGALRNTPFVAAAYKILLAANCAVLLFGGPIMFIVDAVNFAAHDHRLSEASNFWIVLRQPLFTVVVVGAQIVLSLSFVSVTGFDPGHAEEFDRAALYAHMGQARVYDQGLEIAEP